MYQQLSKYLSQYKQVSIPQVGSFELVPQSAALDVASKLIEPPFYLPQYSDKVLVKEHQLRFLAVDLNAGRDEVSEQLENFGIELKNKIQGGIFLWKGVGRLEATNAKFVFHPDVLSIKGFQTISAEKVLRKNVQHTVLRGEQEVLSNSFYEEEKTLPKKRPVMVLIGWTIVLVSFLFIAFYLYRNNFNATASGTRMKAAPANISPTHK